MYDFVLVVEGKNDQIKIKKIYPNFLIVTTGGSRLDQQTKDLIMSLSQKYQIYVLVDPDTQGERIRRLIDEIINVKHLFLKKDQTLPKNNKGSLGIEHASENDLKKIIDPILQKPEAKDINFQKVTLADIQNAQLIGFANSSILRNMLTEKLNIGHVNGKQLLKRLEVMKIDRLQFFQVLKSIEDE